MKRTRTHISIMLALPALFVAGGAAAAGGPGQEFDLCWHTIDGGGGVSAAGGFELTGTIGQHDAGPALAAGGFTLEGGFWGGTPDEGCSADLTDDGILDFFDVAAYLGLFSANDPAADLTNDGILDFFDVLAYLAAFDAGCP